MLTVDASQFYDLPEAARLLWADPARLAREAALRAVPAARHEGSWVLPKPWVEAESGREPTDADALKAFWLERLAPPSFAARRTLRPRSRLPAERLLSPDEAARALFCDPARLERLDADGTLPALRVDGAPRFDADLIAALLAEESDGPSGGPATAARRALVLEWAHAEYTTAEGSLPRADPTLPLRRSEDLRPPRPGIGRAAPEPLRPPPSDAPKAYELPPDLAPPPRSRPSDLSKADGFETVDEE
jgi:hypothetical protein